MTPQEIIEGNKLFAEFMGAKYKHPKGTLWLPIHGLVRYDTIEIGMGKTMKYHSSWDWLMEIVKKILQLCSDTDEMERYYIITDSIPSIEDTWLTCLAFVKWYNQNKEK